VLLDAGFAVMLAGGRAGEVGVGAAVAVAAGTEVTDVVTEGVGLGVADAT
jgi:hypothetical protein